MRKLYRSKRHAVFGGVAAGLAEYFDIDITVMRLLFVLIGLIVPNAILAYILAWIIIPAEPEVSPGGTVPSAPQNVPYAPHQPENSPTAAELAGQVSEGGAPVETPPAPAAKVEPSAAYDSGSNRSRQLFGYILVGIGVLVLLKRFVPNYWWNLPHHVLRTWWPLAIIGLGVALIYSAVRGGK